MFRVHSRAGRIALMLVVIVLALLRIREEFVRHWGPDRVAPALRGRW